MPPAPILSAMLEKLTRILLALVTAFVFTGQMEAAAKHCARLAEQAALETGRDAPGCHETEMAVASHHGMDHVKTDTAAHNTGATSPDTPDTCDCIAALKLCAELAGSSAISHVEPYAWLAVADTDFASAQPDPDLRPPRA